MKVAFVGCGYVADFYIRTLANYSNLQLAGVWDANAETLARFADHWSVPRYRSLDDLLSGADVEMVVNLTNPDSHYEISLASLAAGKHVYTEKPIAMNLEQAKELVEVAHKKGLYLTSAPCTLLSETAQTLWRALRDNKVGPARLAYAQIDDGILLRNYKEWRSESGSPWPWQDEFEVGCVIEHAGYYVTWLVAFFGPASSVDAIGSVLVPDKGLPTRSAAPAADYVVANIHFVSGATARLTCGIVAPDDRSMTIYGDNGELSVADCWDYGAKVFMRRAPFKSLLKKVRPVRKTRMKHHCGGAHNMDFSRGVAELAEAIADRRRCRLPTDLSLHVNEIVLAMENPLETTYPYEMTTSCEPVQPMPWACK